MTSTASHTDDMAIGNVSAMASEIRALRDFAELSADWFWEQDAEFRFTRFFGVATEKLRRKQSDFIGKRRWEMPVSGITAEQLAEHIATHRRHEPFRNFEYEVPGDGGVLQYYSVSGTPVFNEQGVFTGYHGVGRNITELRLAELEVAKRTAEVSQQLHFMEQLIEAIPGPLFYKDRQGRYLGFNQRYVDFIGKPRHELLGATVYDVAPKDLADRYQAADEALFNQPGSQTYDTQVQHANGERREVMFHKATFANRDGNVGGIIGIMLDITELRLAELAIKEREGQLAQIVEGSPIPTFVLDAEHRVTHWNHACERLIGVSADDMVGSRNQWQAFYSESRPVMADLVIRGDVEEIAKLYPKSRKSQIVDDAFEAEDYFSQFDRWLFFTSAPLRNQAGQVVGAIETLEDISERKLSEIALNEAKQAAEAATNAKTAFLANMSHEIRTPMNAIIGLTQLVLDTNLSVKQRDYLGKVQTSSKALLGILNNILDYSKIEAGRLELERIEFGVEEILKQVADLFLAQVEERGLEIFIEVAPNIPAMLMGDPLRLGQVLNNLVGNAIKFTRRGEIHLKVDIDSCSDNDVVLRFAVRDTGIGIAHEELEHLFHAFAQADTSITRMYGGSGLGLAICQHLVEMMDGSITAESVLGKGSIFTFTARLDFGRACEPAHDLMKLHGMRVLVVDDQETSRIVLQSCLESWKFQVTTADSGQDGLDKIERADRHGVPFQLILLDWKMPGMNGLDVAHELENRAQLGCLKRPPTVIMVTAFSRDQLLAEAGSTHIDAILTKPVIPSSLFDTIARVQQPIQANAPHGAEDGAYALIPLEAAKAIRGARILLVEDNDLNQVVAREFLTRAGLFVTVANHGGESVEWVQKAEFDAVLMDIHMPVMDGHEATRLIRKLPCGVDLPILALTAATMVQDRQADFAAGMNDHIAKPIDPDQLISTLLKWVKPGNRQAPLPSGLEHPDTSTLPAELAGFDLDAAAKRLGDNRNLLARLLRRFADDLPEIEDRLDRLLQAGQKAETASVMHHLLGAASNLGAIELCRVARCLDNEIKTGAELTSRQAFSDVLANTVRTIGNNITADEFAERAGKLDIALVTASLRRFFVLLREHEVMPADFLAELYSQLASDVPQTILLKLARQVEQFDYASALSSLQAIASALDVSVEPRN